MTDMSGAAVAERAVARMTEFVRVWKRRGRPAIIARIEEDPSAILAREKTLTVYDAEAVLATLAGLREQVATELDDIVEKLKQRADGSDDPTGRTILLIQADAVSIAAGRVRSQS